MITLITGAAATISAQERATDRRETVMQQYHEVLRSALPCPEPVLRESRDFQLCLLVIPPGHRADERELLVVLNSRGASQHAMLMQPDQPLWKAMMESDAATVQVKSFAIDDRELIQRLLADWSVLTIPLDLNADWFTDPTRYKISVTRGAGSVVVEVAGPGSRSKRQPSRLVKWAEGVRSRAEALLRTEKGH